MKKMMIVWTLMLLLCTAIPVFAASNNSIPLPDDIKIESPDEGANPDLAKFAGKWTGETTTGMKVIFIVEKISSFKVSTVFAWDNKFVKEGWSRQRASYDSEVGNMLCIIKNPPVSGYYIDLKMNKAGELTGTYGADRMRGGVLLKRDKD